MDKLVLSLVFCFVAAFTVYAQDTSAVEAVKEVAEKATELAPATDTAAVEEKPFQILKSYFIQGGWFFMSLVLACLVLGLALVIERIITLNLASVNTNALLDKVDAALSKGNKSEALEILKSTPGPTASVLYEGLLKSDEGLEVVEKSIVSNGSAQMGLLENGVSWISLFISIAPMLGFMGTVIGMVQAFDKIQVSGDVSPTAMAGDIKVALLTTLFGLVAAIILQIGYNYIVSKIDGIVNSMERASISVVDIIAKHKLAK